MGDPDDTPASDLEFSVAVEVNSNQETHASLAVTNPGGGRFPGDDAFTGEMNLWDGRAALRASQEMPSLRSIQPGESVFPFGANWSLESGLYFLSWGAPEYGGVTVVFSVIEEGGRLYLGEQDAFSVKPKAYTIAAARAGSIRSFSLEPDGTLILAGETPIPDLNCVYPVLLDDTGIVPGYPTGICAQIADGRWQLQIPADPDGNRIEILEDVRYRAVLFSDDVRLAPSEPFDILISAPPSD